MTFCAKSIIVPPLGFMYEVKEILNQADYYSTYNIFTALYALYLVLLFMHYI